MKNVTRVKIPHFNFIAVFKFLTPTLTALIFLAAFLLFINQQKQSQQAVSNHTETLNEIQNIVKTLKQNNQTNHDTTILFIQCEVDVLIADSNNRPVTKADFDSCIRNSGLATGLTTVTPTTPTSTSSPPKASQALTPTPQSQPTTVSTSAPAQSSSSAQPAPLSPSPSPVSGGSTTTPKPGLVKQILNLLGL